MPRSLSLALALLALAGPARSEPPSAAPGGGDAAEGTRPKICIVLSGGGARGAAHVGVLKVVEEFAVPVDCVTGTSMGAFVGALYAAGYSAAEIEDVLGTVPWDHVFSPGTPREDLSWRRKQDDQDFLIRYRIGVREGRVSVPAGAVPVQRLRLLLQTLLEPVARARDFDDLPVPFRAVTTDIVTGEKVVLGRGDLAAAVTASMAVPGVLAPIEYDGRLLVDGGVSDNMPVGVAREMGADIVIASDIQAQPYTREQLDNPFRTLDQLSRFLIRQNTRASIDMLGPGDVYLRPAVQPYGSADFERMAEILPIGEAAARGAEAEFRRLAAYGPASRPQRPDPAPRVVDEVVVETNLRVPEAYLASLVSQEPGAPLDPVRLAEDLQRIWGLGRFDDVRWSMEELPGGRRRLLVEAVGDPAETGFIRPGVRIQDNFNDEQSYEIGFNYTWTDINDLGAEWKNTVVIGTRPLVFSELFLPVGAAERYFFAPAFEYRKSPRKIRDLDGNALIELDVQTWEGTLAVGRIFGNVAELRAGVARGGGNVDVRVGEPGVLADSFELAGLAASFTWDTIDDIYFPSTGTYAGAEVFRSHSWLGADTDANLLAFSATRAWNWNRDTLALTGEWGMATGDSAASLFELGGFLHLSGYQPGDIAGTHVRFGRAVYFRQLAGGTVPNPLDVSLYAGGSLELGNAWLDRDDVSFDSALFAGSLFLGAETLLGPVYLATGYAERGEWSVYLFIGNIF